MHWYMLGANQVEKSFAEMDLGIVLVDIELNMRKQYALAAKNASGNLGCH